MEYFKLLRSKFCNAVSLMKLEDTTLSDLSLKDILGGGKRTELLFNGWCVLQIQKLRINRDGSQCEYH